MLCNLVQIMEGPGGSMRQVVGLPNNSRIKPITHTAWVRAQFCKLQKGCTRLAAASDKAYQLLVHGRWFFPGTPASSTTKTGRHDIAEIQLKVVLNTINPNKSNFCLEYNWGTDIKLCVEYILRLQMSNFVQSIN